jgi:hypothetical protein
MLQIMADDSWAMTDLALFLEPIEISDATGKLIGVFVPANLERAKERKAKALAQIDPAELERRLRSKEPGDPHHVVLGRLRMLEQEMERRKEAGEKEFTTDEALAYFRSLREKGLPHAVEESESNAQMEAGECATP